MDEHGAPTPTSAELAALLFDVMGALRAARDQLQRIEVRLAMLPFPLVLSRPGLASDQDQPEEPGRGG